MDDYVSYSAFNAPSSDPLTVDEAMNRSDCEEWKSAMDEEISSLKENNTWTLMNLPPGRNAIKTKWVFK